MKPPQCCVNSLYVHLMHVIREIGSDLQGWLDDITDRGVGYMPEDELKTAAAAERLKISMEGIALLKAAQWKPQPPKIEKEEEVEEEKKKKNDELDEIGEPKRPISASTAKVVEHRALRAAVIQEWHIL